MIDLDHSKLKLHSVDLNQALYKLLIPLSPSSSSHIFLSKGLVPLKKKKLNMGKKSSYLAMGTDTFGSDQISSDFSDLSNAARNLAVHAAQLASLGFGTTFLQWVASFAAM